MEQHKFNRGGGVLLRIGMHMPISGGFSKNLRRLKEYGCQTIQIFSGNPTGWSMAAVDPVEIEQRVNLLLQLDIFPLVIHSAYLINLASPSPRTHRRSTHLLKQTLERAALYRSPYVVLHTGNHGGKGVPRGLEKIIETICKEQSSWPAGVQLLLENTSGSGTALGSRLEEMAAIVDAFPPEAVGVCLDTAHAWAAGYDIGRSGGMVELLNQFDRLIGLSRLRVVHVNDSKVACGSKIDRHQHIGRGLIGEAGFAELLHFPWPSGMPFILETPEMGTNWGQKNLNVLFSLLAKG